MADDSGRWQTDARWQRTKLKSFKLQLTAADNGKTTADNDNGHRTNANNNDNAEEFVEPDKALMSLLRQDVKGIKNKKAKGLMKMGSLLIWFLTFVTIPQAFVMEDGKFFYKQSGELLTPLQHRRSI
ncbi:hypothetical protein LR48_Vigan743s000300 [Vigna angularis]|uniref:Uncharacterized protein n=1 Tax=Phaseolus angularis TaxID=3914 RepID=A0A0L9TGK0_PHAAN|nr:hypothetical protein LR48_Vigan743s000300 [Vigna angularis]